MTTTMKTMKMNDDNEDVDDEANVCTAATISSSRSLVGLVVTKSHACYLLGGTG